MRRGLATVAGLEELLLWPDDDVDRSASRASRYPDTGIHCLSRSLAPSTRSAARRGGSKSRARHTDEDVDLLIGALDAITRDGLALR